MKKLKLYVWENVLRDYTPGIAFALAYDELEARELIYAQKPTVANTGDLDKEPQVFESPKGFALWGGG